jgi:tetratricopeptide (TPR) repeat protein
MGGDSIDIGTATGEVIAGVVHGGVHIHKSPTTIPFDSTPEERSAFVLYREACSNHWMGNSDAALTQYDTFLARYETSHDPTIRGWVAWAGYNKGMALQDLSRLEEASGAFSELLVRSGPSDDKDIKEAVASGLYQWIGISLRKRDYQQVIRLANLVEQHYVDDEDFDPSRDELGGSLLRRAIALNRLGRYAAAIVDAEAIHARFAGRGRHSVKDLRWMAAAKIIVGQAQHSIGKNREAAATFAAVIETYGESSDPKLQGLTNSARGYLAKVAPPRKGLTRFLRR